MAFYKKEKKKNKRKRKRFGRSLLSKLNQGAAASEEGVRPFFRVGQARPRGSLARPGPVQRSPKFPLRTKNTVNGGTRF